MGEQIIQRFWRIGSPKEIRSPSFNLKKFSKTDKTTAELCRKNWNLMNDKEFASLKCLILKYRTGDQIIQTFCTIASPKQVRCPLFNMSKFSKSDKSTAQSCRTHWNLMNDKDFGSFKWLILKYRREDQVIQMFCRIGSPQQITSPLFNFRKFSKIDKSAAESCRMHWNLLNEEELMSFKSLILKYIRGDQRIKPWCRISWPGQIKSNHFSLRKFSKTDKSTAELCRAQWNLMNDGQFVSLICLILKYRGGRARGGRGRDKIIQLFCRIGSPQEIRSLVFNLIWGNLQKLTKVLVIHVEDIEV